MSHKKKHHKIRGPINEKKSERILSRGASQLTSSGSNSSSTSSFDFTSALETVAGWFGNAGLSKILDKCFSLIDTTKFVQSEIVDCFTKMIFKFFTSKSDICIQVSSRVPFRVSASKSSSSLFGSILMKATSTEVVEKRVEGKESEIFFNQHEVINEKESTPSGFEVCSIMVYYFLMALCVFILFISAGAGCFFVFYFSYLYTWLLGVGIGLVIVFTVVLIVIAIFCLSFGFCFHLCTFGWCRVRNDLKVLTEMVGSQVRIYEENTPLLLRKRKKKKKMIESVNEKDVEEKLTINVSEIPPVVKKGVKKKGEDKEKDVEKIGEVVEQEGKEKEGEEKEGEEVEKEGEEKEEKKVEEIILKVEELEEKGEEKENDEKNEENKLNGKEESEKKMEKVEVIQNELEKKIEKVGDEKKSESEGINPKEDDGNSGSVVLFKKEDNQD